MVSHNLQPPDYDQPLWLTSSKSLTLLEPGLPLPMLAERINEVHTASPSLLTLVICNTVERARTLFSELIRKPPNPSPEIHLMHSRFRGLERRAWPAILDSLPKTSAGRIIVATQVVEAGVDLSADVLFMEVCPFPSLVQRLGRLARRGGTGEAFIIPVDSARHAAPYEPEALEATLSALQLLADGSPRALQVFETTHPNLLDDLFPFDPPHLLLRDEINELFDTTADLSGGDIDVSRFIREGDERDLMVAWVASARDARGRPEAPAPDLRPARDALCAVPFHTARDWLCGKKSKGSEPRYLKKGFGAWVWDWTEGLWRTAERTDLRPGAVVLVDAEVGGYDPTRGFDLDDKKSVPVIDLSTADPQEQADSSWNGEQLSATSWQTIAFHGAAVSKEVRSILSSVELQHGSVDMARLLDISARWHDLGKAHPAFQGAILGASRPIRADLAKAPSGAWRRGRSMYQTGTEPRPGLRHELASALALFDVLVRHAAPEHPSRLGSWAYKATADERVVRDAPNALEREILALSRDEFDLVAFLVCAHHGKLRTRLHMGPSDPLVAHGVAPIRGVHQGDVLPATELTNSDDQRETLPASSLSLEPASLGLSPVTGPSWSDRVERLRRTHGPFVLAYLEAVLRSADIRASMATHLVDPALVNLTTEVAR